MKSFEQEIKDFLTNHQLEFKDNSSSFKRLDFSVQLDEKWTFHFDTKEKRQPYNLSNWQLTAAQEPHTFIIDDLAARKILAYAPYSGMVVRNNLSGEYFFFSVVDLLMMPKKRANRPIFKEKQGLKGKWIIDLRNGKLCTNLDEVIDLFSYFIEKREDIFINLLECYGDYFDEKIDQRGQTRMPGHWDIDVNETR